MRELALLTDLVEISSPTSFESDIADYIESRYRQLGHTLIRLDNNLVAFIPGQDQSRAFVESGHIDTVPPDKDWKHHPYRLRPDPADADRVIGLGASDMKSGLAIMMRQAEDMSNQQPPTDQYHVFTAFEEGDQRGAKAATAWLGENVQGRYERIGGVILEPTGARYIGHGHRGDTNWEVTAMGDGGHGSQEYTKPAIERLAQLTTSLSDIRQEWSERYSNPLLGVPMINATINRAGVAANVVPGVATATLNLRVTPELLPHLDDIRAQLKAYYGVLINQSGEPRPSVCEPDRYVYQVAERVLPHMSIQSFQGATEQPYYQDQDVSTLIIGPGDDATMHKANESTSLNAIAVCGRMLDQMIATF